MSRVEKELTHRLSLLPGVDRGGSMFGHRSAYWVNGKEIAHLEAPGVIEIRCTREVIRQRRSQLKSDHRVTLRRSGADWLTVRVRTVADLDLVTELVALAEQAHRPAPGQPAKPVPDGEELERRRRFH